jgi:hypothetical protein
MTKSQEKGENEITDQARREAARSGREICDILNDMLAQARADKDQEAERKIRRAQKYLGCRNKRKRRKTP